MNKYLNYNTETPEESDNLANPLHWIKSQLIK